MMRDSVGRCGVVVLLCLLLDGRGLARAQCLNCHGVPLYPRDIVIADSQGLGVQGTIARVDPLTGEVAYAALGENLVQPYWVVVDSRGDLLVSDRGAPGRIIRIDRLTGAQTVLSEGQFFGSPYGLAIAPDGQLYVTELGSTQERRNRIVRVDPSTGVQTLVSSPSGAFVTPFVDLEGIAVAPNGDIFVADFGLQGGNDGRIIRIDPTSGERTVVAQAGYLEDPRGIVVEPDGKLLVADPESFGGNGAIIEVDPGAQTQTLVANASVFNNPTGIAIEGTGHLIVTDEGTRLPDRVFRLNRSAGTLTVLTANPDALLFQPWGVAIVGGVCDVPCLTHRLDALTRFVRIRVDSKPLKKSLLKAAGGAIPILQQGQTLLDRNRTGPAQKRFRRALGKFGKFERKLDSRAAKGLSDTTRASLREEAALIRTDISALAQ